MHLYSHSLLQLLKWGNSGRFINSCTDDWSLLHSWTPEPGVWLSPLFPYLFQFFHNKQIKSLFGWKDPNPTRAFDPLSTFLIPRLFFFCYVNKAGSEKKNKVQQVPRKVLRWLLQMQRVTPSHASLQDPPVSRLTSFRSLRFILGTSARQVEIGTGLIRRPDPSGKSRTPVTPDPLPWSTLSEVPPYWLQTKHLLFLFPLP